MEANSILIAEVAALNKDLNIGMERRLKVQHVFTSNPDILKALNHNASLVLWWMTSKTHTLIGTLVVAGNSVITHIPKSWMELPLLCLTWS